MFSEVYGYCKGISFGGIPVFVFYELSGHQITRKKYGYCLIWEKLTFKLQIHVFFFRRLKIYQNLM